MFYDNDVGKAIEPYFDVKPGSSSVFVAVFFLDEKTTAKALPFMKKGKRSLNDFIAIAGETKDKDSSIFGYGAQFAQPGGGSGRIFLRHED